ncbi:unnamed protein product [Nezara viridula]|uniref:Uncharacterized protein n=1 Tax=Nezara viridula TaxID=85310 RepID=A0A9P0HSD4_NEZVI|nr:unnamed protein product [Nezara viridula]
MAILQKPREEARDDGLLINIQKKKERKEEPTKMSLNAPGKSILFSSVFEETGEESGSTKLHTTNVKSELLYGRSQEAADIYQYLRRIVNTT